jgi:hypothetical protein
MKLLPLLSVILLALAPQGHAFERGAKPVRFWLSPEAGRTLNAFNQRLQSRNTAMSLDCGTEPSRKSGKVACVARIHPRLEPHLRIVRSDPFGRSDLPHHFSIEGGKEKSETLSQEFLRSVYESLPGLAPRKHELIGNLNVHGGDPISVAYSYKLALDVPASGNKFTIRCRYLPAWEGVPIDEYRCWILIFEQALVE